MRAGRGVQVGFSLVEMAIVLIIVGLLLGSLLKGQELINSSRVRNLADLNSGVQTAYFAFIDRFRAVPGDMSAEAAGAAIGVSINKGGNEDGNIGPAGGNDWIEPLALWEHVSRAGFIQEGDYDSGGTSGASQAVYEDGNSPRNPFNGAVILGRTPDYAGTAPIRLNLVLGRNIPVYIARELDVKVDDGTPNTGALRFTVPLGSSAVFGDLAEGDENCRDAATSAIWAIDLDSQDCNLAFLY